MTDTQREGQGHRQKEKQDSYGEPDVRLDPRTPGSGPEPKIDAQPLSHPGVPMLEILNEPAPSSLYLGPSSQDASHVALFFFSHMGSAHTRAVCFLPRTRTRPSLLICPSPPGPLRPSNRRAFSRSHSRSLLPRCPIWAPSR